MKRSHFTALAVSLLVLTAATLSILHEVHSKQNALLPADDITVISSQSDTPAASLN